MLENLCGPNLYSTAIWSLGGRLLSLSFWFWLGGLLVFSLGNIALIRDISYFRMKPDSILRRRYMKQNEQNRSEPNVHGYLTTKSSNIITSQHIIHLQRQS